MFLKKHTTGASLLLLTLGLVSIVSAAYYEPDLFPIGLSGIMHTGYGPENCPYNSYDDPTTWTWQRELQLIDNLGVNCLGSEDSYKGYIVTFSEEDDYDYLNQVCAKAAPNKPVYLIIPYTYSTPRYYDYGPGTNDSTPVIKDKPGNILSSIFFRSPERPKYQGYGCARFHPDTSVKEGDKKGWYPFGTTSDANWCTFDGTDLWKQMVDETVDNFEDYFLTHPGHAQYVWGYNLITEGYDKHIDKNINNCILTI